MSPFSHRNLTAVKCENVGDAIAFRGAAGRTMQQNIFTSMPAYCGVYLDGTSGYWNSGKRNKDGFDYYYDYFVLCGVIIKYVYNQN